MAKKVAAAKAGRSERAMSSRDQRLADGRALRDAVPRASHARWKAPAKRLDPIAILQQSNRVAFPSSCPSATGECLQARSHS